MPRPIDATNSVWSRETTWLDTGEALAEGFINGIDLYRVPIMGTQGTGGEWWVRGGRRRRPRTGGTYALGQPSAPATTPQNSLSQS